MISCSGNILNKDILLIIGAGKHQTSVIQTATKMGYYTVAVDVDPYAEGFYYSDEHIVESAYDYEAIWKKVNDNYELSAIKGVLTQAARGCILTVSKISEKLGLRHLNAQTALRVLSKEYTTKIFNSNSVIGIYTDFDELPSNMDFPCVCKFENLSGGLGVLKINNTIEMQTLMDKKHETDKVIVETFVSGKNYGVVGVRHCNDLKIYGVIEKCLNTDLTIDCALFPAQLTQYVKDILLEYTVDVLDKIGFDFGPFQLELILDEENSLYFVELEPSILGSYISELMIPATSDNNMIRDSIGLVCNGDLNLKKSEHKYVSLLKFYYTDSIGSIKRFQIDSQNRQVLFKPFINIGEKFTNKRTYVANAFVVGKCTEDVEESIKKFNLDIVVAE